MNSLYKEEILEHYKDPQNFGKLQKLSHSSKLTNPFCGDEVEVFVNLKNKKIENISFVGFGCAISIASTSILTDFAKGKSVSQLTSFSNSDMLELLKIDISETRKKCALLGLSALRDALK